MILYEIKTDFCQQTLNEMKIDPSKLSARWDYRDYCVLTDSDLSSIIFAAILVLIFITALRGVWRIK
jgi:hypothetical protein